MNVILQLESFGAITSHTPNPHYGYNGYDPDQFDAHQEITYADGSRAVLYTTSSLRSDRIRKDQWRASNIKKIDESITHALVVLPDEKGFDQGTETRDKIREGRVFSAIDDIQTAAEFFDETMARFEETLEAGKKNDFQGRTLEDLLPIILDSKENLLRFNGRSEYTGFRYEVFELVMKKLNLDSRTILLIESTTEIPTLPSGGKPKTDVASTITFNDGTVKEITFSLKNSSSTAVSVHEYSAEQFAEVLDPSNEKLKRLLLAFQAAGSKSKMNEADVDSLTSELKPYQRKLNMWVFSGAGAAGTLPVQIADYLILRDKITGDFSIHSVEEYCDLLEANNRGASGFGTIFAWTYPSKKRGKKIQLKAKIIK